MKGIIPVYLQFTGKTIHNSFTSQFTCINKLDLQTFINFNIILHRTKSTFRFYRETTLVLKVKSNACLFFKLLIDTVRVVTSLHQLCLLASLALATKLTGVACSDLPAGPRLSQVMLPTTIPMPPLLSPLHPLADCYPFLHLNNMLLEQLQRKEKKREKTRSAEVKYRQSSPWIHWIFRKPGAFPSTSASLCILVLFPSVPFPSNTSHSPKGTKNAYSVCALWPLHIIFALHIHPHYLFSHLSRMTIGKTAEEPKIYTNLLQYRCFLKPVIS